MFLTVLRKEIVSHVLSLRFGVTFILFIILVFAGIYVTANEHKRDVARFFAIEREAASEMARAAKEADNPESLTRQLLWGGKTDAVPVPAMSAVVQGLRPHTPTAVHTSARDSRSMREASEANPLSGLLRLPDLVYVVSVVLSLLAILFCFDSICGEKESGTLRLMLSNSVPRVSVLLGKWIGGYLVLVVPFLIAACGGLGYAWWLGVLALEGEVLPRLGMLMVVACLYVSAFFTLGLFVSTITHRSATALFICLLIWVVWILAVPNLAPVIAKIVRPAPSAEKINAEKRAVDREIGLKKERLTLTTGELPYGEKIKRERQRLDDEGDRIKARWDRFLKDAAKRQTDLAMTLGRVSPAACWTYAAVALTGTGPEMYERFDQAKKDLQEEIKKLADDVYRERRDTGTLRELKPSDMPRLKITASRLADDLKAAMDDVLVLAILNVLFFLGAFVMFLLYDVR